MRSVRQMRQVAAVLIVVAMPAATITSSATALPSNGRVAVASGHHEHRELFLVDPDSFEASLLTRQPIAGEVAWSPDASRIGFTGNDEEFLYPYVMNADGSGLVRIPLGGQAGFTEWSPDGTKMLLSGGLDIAVADADGSNLRLLGEGHPAGWSPDGRILFSSSGQFGIPADVWLMNADGTGRVQLTFGPEPETARAFSPDGSKILFWRRAGDFRTPSDIWTMNADGTGQRNLTESPWSEGPIAWSPNGDRILFGTDRDVPHSFTVAISTMAADGGDVRRLTLGGSALWSPDGTRIAFGRYDPEIDDSTAYVMNADGTDIRTIRDTPSYDDPVGWEPVLNRAPGCSTVTATTTFLGKKAGFIIANLVGATDPDGDAVSLSVTGVTQDEPLTGWRDHTSPDAFPGTVASEAHLRNEVSNKGDGRVYRISFEGGDGRGGTCTGTVNVSVPRKGEAIDSAPPSYNSFG